MVHPGCLQTRPLSSIKAYTEDKYFMRAPIRTLDLAKPFTSGRDTVQTSLLRRDVCTEIPVTYDVSLTAESDSTYLKTPITHFIRIYLRRRWAGNESGGETVSGRAGDSDSDGAARHSAWRVSPNGTRAAWTLLMGGNTSASVIDGKGLTLA